MEQRQEQRKRLARLKVWTEKKRVYIGNGRTKTKATKVKRYDNRIIQFKDNRNFQTNQGRFFKNLEGKEERTKPLNAKDAAAFWKGIWSSKIEHKRDAEWIDKAKEKMPTEYTESH